MQDNPGQLFEQLEPVVRGLGYTLVEASGKALKGTFAVVVILYRENGIGIDECIEVSRTIQPRIEVLYDTQDVTLEVSSPGLERKMKYFHEFEIFLGKYAKVYVDGRDWIFGTIESLDDSTVTLRTESGSETIAAETILKAQLVYQEVK